MESIRSASNPHLKRLRAIIAGREPDRMALEGDRLIDEALRQELTLDLALVSDERPERASELADRVEVRLVDASLLARASSLVTPPGAVALARRPPARELGELALDARSLVVVVAGVQDPGNLGALARTAEAAGARAVIRLGRGCSPWNSKALRGSMGSLLRLAVVEPDDVAGAARQLAELGFRHVRAQTRDGTEHGRFDWSGRVALWVTAETGSVPDGVEAIAFEAVSIPMAPGVESLNVTAAAAVLLFAAGRTKGEGP